MRSVSRERFDRVFSGGRVDPREPWPSLRRRIHLVSRCPTRTRRSRSRRFSTLAPWPHSCDFRPGRELRSPGAWSWRPNTSRRRDRPRLLGRSIVRLPNAGPGSDRIGPTGCRDAPNRETRSSTLGLPREVNMRSSWPSCGAQLQPRRPLWASRHFRASGS